MNWRDTLFIFVAVLCLQASYSATEAHKHTHELACHVGATELCTYHK